MSNPVTVTVRDGVAIVEINNPPVNALSSGVPEGLMAAIEQADRDTAVQAIVIIGAGRTFVAGADIRDLERAAWDSTVDPPDLHDLLARVEDSVKPVVIAIHGTALGGGLELAMAGHYRIATRDARVGLPEANLGIIPGAEGTQRLPRLVGLERAIDMCVSGKLVSAEDAHASGLLDRIVDGDLSAAASALAREVANGGGPHRRDARSCGKTRHAGRQRSAACGGPRDWLGRSAGIRPRQWLCSTLLEAAATMPFEQGCRRERALALASVRSDQCRALVHAFMAERAVAKVPGVTEPTSGGHAPPRTGDRAEVRTVAIIGAGTMGGGIAMACANAGLRVMLTDASQDRLDAGYSTIRRNYDSSIKRGRLTPEAVEERLARIERRIGHEACAVGDVVIEAVYEDMALKKQVFATIDAGGPA